MGNCCESKNESRGEQTENPKPLNKYNSAEIKQRFNDYIFKDNIQDFTIKNYDLNDPIFKLIKKEEVDLLTKFYISKKTEYSNDMNSYLGAQNINFANQLTKQIISIEGGRDIYDQKIENEINFIKNREDLFKINYLTILIMGTSGTGKSTLVNSLLKLRPGKDGPKVGRGKVTTQEPTREFSSKKVPYLRLIDTRGIELSKGFNVKGIETHIENFIKDQLSRNKIEDFVHCIWYCVSSDRFQDEESDLINSLIEPAKRSKIPIIIVLTQSVDKDRVEEMTKYIKDQNFEDIIGILAERKELINDTYVEPYNLDKLLKLSIKKCQEAFNGDMKKVMMDNLTKYIKKRLFSKISSIKNLIIEQMMNDTFDNDLANQNFEGYINEIYYYNICYFLDKNRMEKASSKLIENSDFNMHKKNYFSQSEQYENKLVQSKLSQYANKLLDIQATKEKERGHPVVMINKRNFNDFVNTTGKFLKDNFKIFSTKIYIDFVIKRISGQLTTSFEQELNLIVENLMIGNKIQNSIANCFYRKFTDFDNYVKKCLYSSSTNDFYVQFEEDIEKPWMANITNNNN